MPCCFLIVSDNVIDEVVGTIQFSENFSARYGACHPMFYQGTLEDAVKEALLRPAKQVSSQFIDLHELVLWQDRFRDLSIRYQILIGNLGFL